MRTYNKQQTIADIGQNKRSINLLLSGFARQSQMSIEKITAVIDVIPEFHLVGLDEIIYDPGWETTSALELEGTGCPRQSKGVFLRNKRRILIFKFDNVEELQHIFYHEIGHHVFDRVLTTELRKKWVTIINPKSRHITRYARRNALEDFAECYAIFLLDPKKMETVIKKYTFLRDQVFGGVSYNISQGHLDVSI